ncbi:MAG: alkaline phosphatase [Porphyromonas sp.]|nr:alkaline phosphatase [Porphyromonas sp.]
MNIRLTLKPIVTAFVCALAVWTSSPLYAQTTNGKPVKQAKNVILMIADGTSLSVLSGARWYQRYLDENNKHLHLDPYMSGTIITFSSDAPIGDSAPTTSCYVTGMPSRAGYVATYPQSTPGADLVPVDTTRSFRPLMTLMEATRIKHKRKTGLVFTCEFPHATPADCSAHSYSRKRYDWIVPQMVHNQLDVVIGGGAGLLSEAHQKHLRASGVSVFLNDKEGASKDSNPRMWQLYEKSDMPYDIDRDPKKTPSLAEMTADALRRLSSGEHSENGFFLMVEGSKVDWAAHANDPVALVTEFIAFDKAFAEALDFAKRDGNTVIIVTSDHGNSGFSLGRREVPYATASKQLLFGALTKAKKTSEFIAGELNKHPYSEARAIVEKHAGFVLTDKELELLAECKGYKNSPKPAGERSKTQIGDGDYKGTLPALINHFFHARIPLGFTTNGHTAEEVFLAVYTPEEVDKLVGVNQNTDLYRYMATLLSMGDELPAMSDRYFAPHDEVFKGMSYSLTATDKGFATLKVKGKRGISLEIEAYSNIATVKKGGKTLLRRQMPTVAVYVDKRNKLYLPMEAREWIK